MTRVAGVAEDQAAPLTRLVYRLARRTLGRVPGPVKVLARHPPLMYACGAFENFRARFNSALSIDADGFSDGAYCEIPERAEVAPH